MKVLITGGGGFIGSYVVEELLNYDCDIIVYDIVEEPFMRHNNVQYIHATILDKLNLCKHLRGCDAVFHLAALLGVRRVAREQLRCLSINIEGIANLLEACVIERVPYILFTSSSEIYGDINSINSEKKIDEESPWNPKSNYAIAKLVGERYIKAFHQEYGLKYNIIRFFNIYGPRQADEFVVSKFVKMAMKGIPLTIYGDGRQVRSFCYIKDAVEGLIKAFMNTNVRNQILNIGNDQEPISIKDLGKKIIDKTNTNLKPIYVPFEQSDRSLEREIFDRVPNISKAKRLLNYSPSIRLDEGIDKTIEFFKTGEAI